MDLSSISLKEAAAAANERTLYPLDFSPYETITLILILERFALENEEFQEEKKKGAVQDPQNWALAIRREIRDEIKERLRKDERQKDDVTKRLRSILGDLESE